MIGVILGDKIDKFRKLRVQRVILGDKINKIKEIEGAEGDNR